MTKQDIWDKKVAGWRLSMTDKGHACAMSAMDEYAKQQAIAFMKWALDNDRLHGDNYGFVFIHHPETEDTLFEEFKKETIK